MKGVDKLTITALILVIGVILLIVLIVKELTYIKKLKLKRLIRGISLPQQYKRTVVPSPSIVKESISSKEIPKSHSWLKDITSRISEVELGRHILKTRLITKHAKAEAEKEFEQEKREKLKKKIAELEKKAIKQFVKPTSDNIADAIELARETTEFEHSEQPEIPIITYEQNSTDQFNSHLASLYKKINSNELSEAKATYRELIGIYNEIVDKVENKLDLYNAVKDAHDKLAAAIKSEQSL